MTIERNSNFDEWIVPMFLEVRTDRNWNGYTPYGDLRVGYCFADGSGYYVSPTVGYRFSVTRKMNLNVGIGLTLRGISTDCYSVESGDGYYSMTYTGKTQKTKAYFTFRLGFDF